MLFDEEGKIIKEVKVLDVDTISQVKEKILDAIHLNKPYSSRPSANQVSLEWRRGVSGRLVLTDMDPRPTTDNWRRINMLKDFHVGDNDQMMIVEKQDIANATLSRPILKFSQGDEESTYSKLFLTAAAFPFSLPKNLVVIIYVFFRVIHCLYWCRMGLDFPFLFCCSSSFCLCLFVCSCFLARHGTITALSFEWDIKL